MLGSSPNPFNPVTKIKFAVNKPGNYALRLYNVQGALIRTVASRHFDAGQHEATWDGRTNGGEMAASGVYYAKMSGASKGIGSDGIKLVLSK
jgi:flagellar hook assembly protein FlgD